MTIVNDVLVQSDVLVPVKNIKTGLITRQLNPARLFFDLLE